ncbi:hypothetical protein OG430_00290 [Streptomyces sp. NBC_01304]|nr:hypothetical protein OG430_00290 [Streptomyces sp. NBC_01304]
MRSPRPRCLPTRPTASSPAGTVPPDSFVEDVAIPHRYNRLLLYAAHTIHSASDYCGTTLEDKRMTAVFFWMAQR